MGTKTASGRGLLARLLKQDRRLTLPAGAAEYPGAEALTNAARVVDHPLTSAGMGAGVGTGLGALGGLSAGPALGLGAAGAGIFGGGQMLARAINNRHMAGRINKALNAGVSPTALMGNAQTRNYNRIAAILRDEARLNDATTLAEKLAPAAKVVGTGVGVGAGGNALLRLMSGKESTASVKFASPLRGPALEVPAAAPKTPSKKEAAEKRPRIILVRGSLGGDDSLSNASARVYAKSLKRLGYRVDEINLGDVPFVDEWDSKYTDKHRKILRRSDATVFATPVYNWGPSARVSAYLQNVIKSGDDPYRPYAILGAAGSERAHGYLTSLQNSIAMEDKGINVGAPLLATDTDMEWDGDKLKGVSESYKKRLEEHAEVLAHIARNRKRVKFASPLRGPALEVPAAAPLRSLETALPQYPVSKLIGSRLTAPVISSTLGLAGGPVTAAASAAQSGLISHVTRGASERTIAGRMRKALMDGLPTDAYLTGNQRRVYRAVQTAEALSAPARLSKGKAALLAALGLGAGAGAVGLLGGSEKTAETYNQRYGRRMDPRLGIKRPEGPSSPGAAFNAISNAFKPSPAAPKTSPKPKVMKFTEREVGTIGGPTGPNMSMPRPAPKPAPAPSQNMSMPRPAPISSEEPRVGPTTEHVNFSRGDTATARPPKIVPGKPIINEGIREVNFSRKNPVNIDDPFGKRLPRVAKKRVLKNRVLHLDGYGTIDLSKRRF